jgi:hypothetical protein
MRTLICVGLVLLLAGCVPIGIRASTQFTAASPAVAAG